MSYGIDRRRSLGPVLLWLWCRLAAAAQLGLRGGKTPYVAGTAKKKKKKKGWGGVGILDPKCFLYKPETINYSYYSPPINSPL